MKTGHAGYPVAWEQNSPARAGGRLFAAFFRVRHFEGTQFFRLAYKFEIYYIHLPVGPIMKPQHCFFDDSGKTDGRLQTQRTVELFLVLLFSLVDAVMTLVLLNLGAWEANPMMRYALEMGPSFFIFSKYFLTAAGFLFLLRNAKLRIFRNRMTAEELAYGLILLYAGLVLYEIKIFQIVT